jgi:hypothetical protein
MNKPTYEELVQRFQTYCKHDGGRTYDGVTSGLCTICGWDTSKCQHRSEQGNFCSQCGELLRGEEKA